LVFIQGATVVSIAAISAADAANRGERELSQRLRGATEVLTFANFPMTTSVLDRLRQLSGAEFAALSDDSPPRLSSGLPAASFRQTATHPANMPLASSPLADWPTLRFAGVDYAAARIRSREGEALLILVPQSLRQKARWQAARIPVSLGCLSLLVLGGVTSWIANRTAKRVRRLQSQVSRIAQGDFQKLAIDGRPDEIHDLATSINIMSAELVRMRDAIVQSERARLLGQLAAGLAHQLRNALTGARLSIQLHQRRCDPEPSDRSLEVALRQLEITEEELKRLLAVGQGESAARLPCDLFKLMEDVAALVDPACKHAKVSLEIRTPLVNTEPSPINLTSVRSALVNLVLNAIEAAGPNGRVVLETITDRNRVAVAVADSGPGPPSLQNASIVDPFVTTKTEGVGLGLALANRIAEEHGGSLDWSRQHGTTQFRLWLPASSQIE
jgi:signal transduction histidine kinase